MSNSTNATVPVNMTLCEQKVLWLAHAKNPGTDSAILVIALMVIAFFNLTIAFSFVKQVNRLRGQSNISGTLWCWIIYALAIFAAQSFVFAGTALSTLYPYYCKPNPQWSSWKSDLISLGVFQGLVTVITIGDCLFILVFSILAMCGRRGEVPNMTWGSVLWALCIAACTAPWFILVGLFYLIKVIFKLPSQVRRHRQAGPRARPERADRRRWFPKRRARRGGREQQDAEAGVELAERPDGSAPDYADVVRADGQQAESSVQRPTRALTDLFPYIKDTAAPPPYVREQGNRADAGPADRASIRPREEEVWQDAPEEPVAEAGPEGDEPPPAFEQAEDEARQDEMRPLQR